MLCIIDHGYLHIVTKPPPSEMHYIQDQKVVRVIRSNPCQCYLGHPDQHHIGQAYKAYVRCEPHIVFAQDLPHFYIVLNVWLLEWYMCVNRGNYMHACISIASLKVIVTMRSCV